MRYLKRLIVSVCLVLIIGNITGCSKNIDYGEVYNYETDYQYSYNCSVVSWRDIQSDGTGQYIYKNNYIYYYDMNSKTFAPLCNKANCLHDKETEDNKKTECNAYASEGAYDYGNVINTNTNIQYYDGYIYYVRANSLYRVKKDGSKKDKIFTSEEELPVNYWLLHRGVFYYETEPFYYGEDKTTQIYTKCVLKALDISDRMKEKNAEIVFESDEEHTGIGFGPIAAYKDYLSFSYNANQKDYVSTSNEDWLVHNNSYTYLYNVKTKDLSLIQIPEGYSETTVVGGMYFLDDKILVRLYDNLEDETYTMPIYSINYDMTDEKIWLDDDIPQDMEIQVYDDYVILFDLDYQFFIKDNQENCNYTIYSKDAEKMSEYVCPTYGSVDNRGFGPDGIQVLFEENDNTCNIYELDIDNILNLTGEEVKPELIGELYYSED